MKKQQLQETQQSTPTTRPQNQQREKNHPTKLLAKALLLTAIKLQPKQKHQPNKANTVSS